MINKKENYYVIFKNLNGNIRYRMFYGTSFSSAYGN